MHKLYKARKNQMRGKTKTVRNFKISGNIFLQYEEDTKISEAIIGDIKMYICDDLNGKNKIIGNYFAATQTGYLKAEIFDGKFWKLLITQDFFPNQENHFHKKEMPIDTYNNCKAILQQYSGMIVYKTYREHYTTAMHEPSVYKGKKGQK
jgi:hypothetical protein